MAQPDGRIRVVNYYADGENGFRAEVKFEGKADNPTPRQSAFNSVQVASTVNTHSSVSASDVASRWNGVPAPVHQGSYRNEHSTQNVDYTIIPASSQLSSGPGSPFVLGRSVGPATRLSPIVVGYDAREPHGNSLISIA